MPRGSNLTPEEKAQRVLEAKRKYAEKQKAKREEAKRLALGPDYKTMYLEEVAKNRTLENKILEYEKLCKSYAEREANANKGLQRAALEYNARVKYMQDCVRHAYTSIQFAVNAMSETPVGGQNND